MKRWLVTSERGPTITTWQRSARNARFAYSLTYRLCGKITATEQE